MEDSDEVQQTILALTTWEIAVYVTTSRLGHLTLAHIPASLHFILAFRFSSYYLPLRI